jgi:hypothetical protein
MSSLVVRQWFRNRIVLAVPSIPFLDTVNQIPNPKNLPDLWATIEFTNASEQRLTLGQNAIFRELGQVSIAVLGLSGKGDNAVVAAAELYREAFSAIAESVVVGAGLGYMRIDAAEPPTTDPTESGNWFLGSVSCAYTFDVVRAT